MQIRTDFYSDDIAKCLCRLANKPTNGTIFKDSEEAIYHLRGICQNEYNNDYFRTLWELLQDVCTVHSDLIYND